MLVALLDWASLNSHTADSWNIHINGSLKEALERTYLARVTPWNLYANAAEFW